MRAVIDTGVWVSALLSPNPKAPPPQLFRLIENGRVRPVVSLKLLNEITNVLGRKKFLNKTRVGKVAEFVNTLAAHACMVPDVENPPAVTRDPKDDYLVALAAAQKVPLVSGDRGILEAGLSPPALRPAELVASIDPFRSRGQSHDENRWMLQAKEFDPRIAAQTLPADRSPVSMLETGDEFPTVTRTGPPPPVALSAAGTPRQSTARRNLSSFLKR
ncbi:MAG: putative toxin-antitoxin system toxin component, PIN family [Mycobacteriales bacterium]